MHNPAVSAPIVSTTPAVWQAGAPATDEAAPTELVTPVVRAPGLRTLAVLGPGSLGAAPAPSPPALIWAPALVVNNRRRTKHAVKLEEHNAVISGSERRNAPLFVVPQRSKGEVAPMRFPHPVAVACRICGHPTVEAETPTGFVRVHCGTWRWQCDAPVGTRRLTTGVAGTRDSELTPAGQSSPNPPGDRLAA